MKMYNKIKVAGTSILISILASLNCGGKSSYSEYSNSPRERYEIWRGVVNEISDEEWKRAEQIFEKRDKKNIEDKLNMEPALPNDIASEEIKRGYEIPELEKIVKDIKYSNGPTEFAGDLYESSQVKKIKEEMVEYSGKESLRISEAEGLASYYETKEGFIKTATGSKLKNNRLTASVDERLGYRLPCFIGITNLENGEYIVAVANDHGPYEQIKGKGDGVVVRDNGRIVPSYTRLVDLTKEGARRLGFGKKGIVKVRVKYLGELD